MATFGAFSSQPQQQSYCQSFLEKKEKKWISYWVVLRGPHMWFFKDRTNDMKKFVGRLDLNPTSQVQLGKTKKNNCQFTLTTSRGLYRLKSVNDELRKKWMHWIVVAATGVPPPTSPGTAYPQGGYPQGGYPQGGYPSGFGTYPPPQHRPAISPTGYPPPIPSVNRNRPPAALPPGEIAPPIGRRPPQPLPGEAEAPPLVPPLPRPRQASEPMLLPGQIIELEEKRKQEALLPGQKIAMEEERRRRREETLRKRQSEPALHSSPPPLPGGGGARGADPYVDMAPVPLDRMMDKTLSFHERQSSTERRLVPPPPIPEPGEPDDDECDYISPWENADWFYSPLSRDKAENLLNSRGEMGSFLIRESESRKGEFSLSIRDIDKIKHFQILKSSGGFVLSGSDSKTFQDLGSLVVFYTEMNKGSVQPLLKTTAVLGKSPNFQPKTNPPSAEIDKEALEKRPPEPLEPPDDDEDLHDYLDLDPKLAEKNRASASPTSPAPPSSDENDGYEFPSFDETATSPGPASPGPASIPPAALPATPDVSPTANTDSAGDEETTPHKEESSHPPSSNVGRLPPLPPPADLSPSAEFSKPASSSEPPPPTESPPPEDDVEELYDAPDAGQATGDGTGDGTGDSSNEPKMMYVNTARSDAYIAEDAAD